MKESNALLSAERFAFATKVFVCIVATVVLAFLSLCIMGAAGDLYPYSQRYDVYSPLQVGSVLFEQAYNALAGITHHSRLIRMSGFARTSPAIGLFRDALRSLASRLSAQRCWL